VKTKLTITVDRDLLPKAKESARRRGVSLSSIVEQALRGIDSGEGPTFSERWRGKFQPAGKTTPRYRRLARKFL
jgi:hypothetical protein